MIRIQGFGERSDNLCYDLQFFFVELLFGLWLLVLVSAGRGEAGEDH